MTSLTLPFIYRTFPRVRGQYDNAYRPFRLDGVQSASFEAVTQFLRSQNIPLVVVNLPLSADYLDPVRFGYEQQFQNFFTAVGQSRCPYPGGLVGAVAAAT